ncbi:ribonuclease H-like domain-containing protein [Cyathus striatus]|nr:ribonuclease H-like domain-containing protein [Cyathus striatus]
MLYSILNINIQFYDLSRSISTQRQVNLLQTILSILRFTRLTRIQFEFRAHPITALYSYKTNCPQAQLYYVRYVDAANRAITLLCNGPVGFDLEWKPNFVKGAQENPVALVQLATHQVVVLIQVSAMKEFPEKLKEFLENPDIVKAGVAIQRQYKNPIGLSKLLEHYEKLSLKKGKTTRSNWENQLSYVQQEYAANDAHAGYTIYNRLLEMARSMPEFPDSVYYTFDAVRGRLCEPSGAQWYARNPNYDPGPPPPPKPVKSPRIGDIVVTGTPTDQSVPSLLPPTSTPHPIVTTNPHWNPWWSNQPSQQWPNTPHINIGTQPPGMGWFNPHSNPGHNGRLAVG